jgi:hypothetical protein
MSPRVVDARQCDPCLRFPMTGGCNCGAVRYEVTAELLGAS